MRKLSEVHFVDQGVKSREEFLKIRCFSWNCRENKSTSRHMASNLDCLSQQWAHSYYCGDWIATLSSAYTIMLSLENSSCCSLFFSTKIVTWAISYETLPSSPLLWKRVMGPSRCQHCCGQPDHHTVIREKPIPWKRQPGVQAGIAVRCKTMMPAMFSRGFPLLSRQYWWRNFEYCKMLKKRGLLRGIYKPMDAKTIQ